MVIPKITELKIYKNYALYAIEPKVVYLEIIMAGATIFRN